MQIRTQFRVQPVTLGAPLWPDPPARVKLCSFYMGKLRSLNELLAVLPEFTGLKEVRVKVLMNSQDGFVSRNMLVSKDMTRRAEAAGLTVVNVW